ncbi:MAG: hypothetical protein KAJ39_07070 [Gammaproteobacteria bacterium]|nr:hypothetical protein [Gammaproteobacteria bacterium]
METDELIELWKEQDPELQDIDGLREFIQSRASLNTIIIDKSSGNYPILTALTHLSKIGDFTLIFDDFEMLVNVKGNSTGNFTVPIPDNRFSQYEISEAMELTDIVSAKLFKMLSETKKNADQIEINITADSIYIYATFKSGSRFSYEIDINAENLSLRNAVAITA